MHQFPLPLAANIHESLQFTEDTPMHGVRDSHVWFEAKINAPKFP